MLLTVKVPSPCRRNAGWGWEDHILAALDYDCDSVVVTGDTVHFTLNDEDGWIGDYEVKREAFERFELSDWRTQGF
jgi:hypothetical protein